MDLYELTQNLIGGFCVVLQEELDVLLLCLQTKTASSLLLGGDAEIDDVFAVGTHLSCLETTD